MGHSQQIEQIFGKSLNDAEVYGGDKFIPFLRQFSIAGNSSASLSNYEMNNVSASARTLRLATYPEELLLVVHNVTIVIDSASGTWTDATFAGDTALNSGLSFRYYSGTTKQQDYFVSMNATGGSCRNNRQMVACAPSHTFIDTGQLVPNRMLKLIFPFNNLEWGPTKLDNLRTLRVEIGPNDTISGSTSIYAYARGFRQLL